MKAVRKFLKQIVLKQKLKEFDRKSYRHFLYFLGTLFALDVVSKIVALEWIPKMQWGALYPFGGVPLFSWGQITFSLNTAFNTGAAWGIFPGHSGFLFAVRVLVIIALIWYLFRKKERTLSYWMIVVGAVGNAVDYCLYGGVIDFLHFTFWGKTFPIFNFADSYITIGAALLVLVPKKIHDSRLRSKS